ncbi:MAG: pyrroline-5-carboxylate reductase [Clostridia bacterium]|nr:pyrroline-5-carboxylate reductase [Clostridia bacterium]
MLGFIGMGNMASAILRGVMGSGLLNASDVLVYDVLPEKVQAQCERFGVGKADGAAEIAERCDTVVLAVKPQVLPALLDEIGALLKAAKPLVLTIAAGKPLAFYETALGKTQRIVRIMPNINATVGAAVSAYCPNAAATETDCAFADAFCASFGTAMRLPESQFSVFGVVGGCAPAFVQLFMDALARAGVRYGLPKDTALQIAAQTVLGSAKLLMESGEHPQQIIDNVCSPGGTTIEGVLSLQKDGFEAAVANAVRAAVEKDAKL